MNFKEELTAQEPIVSESVTVKQTMVSNGIQKIELTVEYIASQILLLFTMLKSINAPMGQRYSMKSLWQLLSNIPMPKATGTELRKELEELGFVAGANGSIPTFADLENCRGLIQFAIFDNDSYIIPKLDTTNMNPSDLELYTKTYAEFALNFKTSEWEDTVKKIGLTLPDEYNPENITIYGEELEDLEDRKLTMPEVTDFLPEDAYLIAYTGHPYFYVTTRQALAHSLKAIALIPMDIVPIFYQTFNGGTWTEQELEAGKKQDVTYPFGEYLPKGAQFEMLDGDFWLSIFTITAYLVLIKTRLYQKYIAIDNTGGHRFDVVTYNIFHEQTEETFAYNCEHHIFPFISKEIDASVLLFLKEDLVQNLEIDTTLIAKVIDQKIASL
ncbi:hypothetical protein [Candidatus Sulfurimonas baltica]|uniref:Uncharacterized protein n=1 Tax=Candidatus Sulfurimonas baltica TaxID=2740404 RepID=A0A7S7LW88_9BACT|nr:hypothetical protein [Candidatus Sulfurimonas baltica]QOY52477.1 hypothetical protein HUE88_01915 [Candidatus Sulfurimonas baltica]